MNIWDDIQKIVYGKLDYKTEVLAIKLRRDYTVVLTEAAIYVNLLASLDEVMKFDTISNPMGLIALSPIATA